MLKVLVAMRLVVQQEIGLALLVELLLLELDGLAIALTKTGLLLLLTWREMAVMVVMFWP